MSTRRLRATLVASLLIPLALSLGACLATEEPAARAVVAQGLEEEDDATQVDPLARCTEESCTAAVVGADTTAIGAQPPASARSSEALPSSDPPDLAEVIDDSDAAGLGEANVSRALATARFLKDDGHGGDCPQVGQWKEAGKTCTLVADLDQPIVIQSDNVKLDCAGHAIAGGTEGYGILIEDAAGVTVQNCRITGFGIGLLVYRSSRATVKDNTFGAEDDDGTQGAVGENMRLEYASDSRVVGNSLFGRSRRTNLRMNFSNWNEVRGNHVEGSAVLEGIALREGHHNRILENAIVGNQTSGISIFSNTDQVRPAGNLVSRNTISSNGARGIWVRRGEGTRIEGNTISGSGETNLRMEYSSGSQIVDNIIVGGTGHNLEMKYDCRDNEVRGNWIEGAQMWSGVVVNEGSSYNQIVDNVIIGSNLHGISVTSANEPTKQIGNVFRGNTISASGENGIFVQRGELNRFEGNDVSGSALRNIYFRDSHRNTVTGNRIHASKDRGIDIRYSDANTISANTVTNNPGRGFSVGRSNRNVVQGNRIESSGENGLVISSGDDNQVLDNTVVGSQGDGILLIKWWSLDLSGNLVRGNLAGANGGQGIRVGNSQRTAIVNNTVENNSRSGIFIESATASGWSTLNSIAGNIVSGNGLATSGDSAGIEVRGRYTSVADNTLSGDRHGIYVRAHDNRVENNVACDSPGLNGEGMGIFVVNSQRVEVRANQTCRNARDGIRLANSGTDSVVEGNRSWDNGDAGLTLLNTRRVTASNNHLADNADWGLLLWRSRREHTIERNVMFRTGNSGLFVVDAKSVNSSWTWDQIHGNAAVDSGSRGIRLQGNLLPSLVYDNVFLNAVNTSISSSSVAFTWSVSPTAGPNVVGGPWIGGNWWGERDGSGPAQTWADANGDGFTDYGAVFRWQNIDGHQVPVDVDWYPLSTTKLTLCHRPWTSTTAPVTIQLDPTESDPVGDHLAHGDLPGPCR